MKNLTKAFEIDNGLKSGGVILPDSVVDSIRSSKPTFTGDLLTTLEFYNALTQVNADRILKCDFTYSGDDITGQVNTYYESNGVTVHQTETITYSYTGDTITKVEVV
jgi:hypothetical protein